MSSERRKVVLDLEHEETKKISLYYLYLYHKNYTEQPRERKKEIRDYYEENLRYKGSFYRDRKRFEELGDPREWETKRLMKYKVVEEEQRYFKGMNIYQNFFLPQTTLIELEVSKECDYTVIDLQEDIIKESGHYMRFVDITVNQLEDLMQQIDNVKGLLLISKSNRQTEFYNMEWKQVIFKLEVNEEYIRFISTRFVTHDLLRDSYTSVLNDYLRRVSGIDEDKLTKIKPSIEFEEGFKLKKIAIQRIYLVKRTNRFNYAQQRKYRRRNFDIEARRLESIYIEDVGK